MARHDRKIFSPSQVRGVSFLLCLSALLAAWPVRAPAQEPPTPKRHIIVGGDSDIPPYEFLDEHDTPAGATVELTRAIAHAMGFEAQIVFLPRVELGDALRSGRIDAIQGLIRSPERDKLFDFSRPHLVILHAIFVRQGNRPIQSIDDLRGKEIVIRRGSAMQQLVLDKGLSETPILVDSNAEALGLISSGKHDCAIVARLPGLRLARELELDNVVMDGPTIGPSDACYAVRKGDSALLATLSEGLGIVSTSGEYDKIYRRWFEVAEPGHLPLGIVLKYAGVTVVISLVIFFATAAILWTRTLNSLVVRRTKELQDEIARRAEAEKEIERLARFPAENPNPMLRVSREGVVLYANRTGETILHRLGAAVGATLKGELARNVSDVFAAGANREVDVTSDGRIFSFFCALIPEEGYVNLYGRDVTEHRTADKALRRANRAYQVLSDSNQALVRITDEPTLLREVCRILCEVGGYRLAWIGFAEHDPRKTVRPVAWSGCENGYLENTDMTWADTDRGAGPAGTAIRTGRLVVCRDIPTDPACIPWRQSAIQRGYASSIALPLTTKGDTLGALSIYAGEPDRFDDDETKLLSELADDLTYGIMALRSRRELESTLGELGKREERFKSTLDSMMEGCQIIGFDWRYLYVNEVAASHGRRAKEDLVGRSMMEVYPGIETTEMFAALKRCMEQKLPTHLENEFLYPDGARGWFELGVVPVPEGIFMLSLDTTERKRAEAALAESREKYQSMVENIQIGVSLIGRNMEILELNRQIRRWFPDVRPGKGVICYRNYNDPPRETPCEYCPVLKTFTDGEVHEAVTDTPAGNRVIHFRVVSSPVRDSSGSVIGAIELVEDITERLAMEEQMRETAKLESIGRLAGGVAHDFNNLLTGILGYAQLLLTQVKGQQTLENDLTQIRELSTRAADLTRQLLAFSRRQPIQPVVFNLNSLVADAAKMLQRMIGEDVELVFRGAPDLGNIRAEAGQIEQILLNLAVNARDAMPEGGKLTIETSNVVLDRDYAGRHFGVTPGPHIMLAVSDTGCGMDETTRRRIFEPFFTTKEKGKGTGLGLATVYGIAKQHGGSIYVYSEVNKGTTFKVYFPRVYAPAQTLGEKGPGAAPTGTETVLVVEDEESVRALVERVLAERGYAVLACGSPAEAEALLETSPAAIHLLLTDVVLPGESGKDLHRRLLARHPSLPVLYMSGYTDNTIVHHGVLEAGMPFIQKPFDPDALARKVRDVLDAPEL
ncbi:MAG: transporter substrate-binding domain-containing protein [Planctomycetota bacterium]